MTLFPFTFKGTIDMIVSFRRITEFLNADELTSADAEDVKPKDLKNALEMKAASFTWQEMNNPQLKNIDLTVKKGTLTAIVGIVGSGKSSILQAILGEMEIVSGDLLYPQFMT